MNESAILPLELPEDQRRLIFHQYLGLLRAFKKDLSSEDKVMIRKAFELAAEAHKSVNRKDGTPYITHPIEVARISIEEIGLGPTAAVCALLHDVVEDTEYGLEYINREFPDPIDPDNPPKPGQLSKIARIVDGLTKLEKIQENENENWQIENLGKVMRSMLDDQRVVLIKMADRLHNLRTIGAQPEIKRLKIAAETESVYTPLAHQLGLYKVKTEFQDICLKITNRVEYDEIADKLSETKSAREKYISEFIEPIQAMLKEQHIEAKVFGRPKSIHSIWTKMKDKKVSFEHIYDLFAIRIIIPTAQSESAEKAQIWLAYATLTDIYRPIPGRLKDHISEPKPNGYQSLHTTVLGPQGRYVEIQIRSERMDDIAERGFAAHWKYKGAKTYSQGDVYERWLRAIRESIEKDNSQSIVDAVRGGVLEGGVVHVFTPKGEMHILPEGATALDFAFSIHTDIGCKCIGIQIVGGGAHGIDYVIQNGDQIKVITGPKQKPKEEWLKIIKTSKARNRIRAAINEEKRELAKDGKEILDRKLKNMFDVNADDNVDMLTRHFKAASRIEFLCQIANEGFDFTKLKSFKREGLYLIYQDPKTQPHAESDREQEIKPSKPIAPKRPTLDHSIIINNDPSTPYAYMMAPCCTPIQGEPIFAFLTRDHNQARIHRQNCSNAKHMMTFYPTQVLDARWANLQPLDQIITIHIEGRDTGSGVIQQLGHIMAKLNLNAHSMTINSNDNGYFTGEIALHVRNSTELNIAINELRKSENVTYVSRED
jgi:GTP diphosphokinase / guanosine-3',5'-bis(diphosphate) 3'-diphosphatase